MFSFKILLEKSKKVFSKIDFFVLYKGEGYFLFKTRTKRLFQRLPIEGLKFLAQNNFFVIYKCEE